MNKIILSPTKNSEIRSSYLTYFAYLFIICLTQSDKSFEILYGRLVNLLRDLQAFFNYLNYNIYINGMQGLPCFFIAFNWLGCHVHRTLRPLV